MQRFWRGWVAALAAVAIVAFAFALARGARVTAAGPDVFVDFHGEAPGRVHHITVADLPAPYASKAVANGPRIAPRPADVWPQTLPGFQVAPYATGLDNPRLLRVAPNGDLFLAESEPGKILVFRGRTADGKPQQQQVFASGLTQPFGIAFYPAGRNPRWVYVGDTNAVLRYPYRNGDLTARGPAETVLADLPSGGGHWTRSIDFSRDGKTLFVAVGSRSNVDDPDTHPQELHRANVLAATPEGKDLRVFASGIRNPAGLAVDPSTGEVWVSVNERDMLGDNLPPDYITHVRSGGFYGWPWYYIGGHQDPRLTGTHPELRDKVIVPDVLLQPHNASLELTFYQASQFPSEYRGGIFAAEHGSWNRAVRTGYEIVYVPRKNGRATGQYMDFVTGFVLPNGDAWGRPVGIAVASDGSLMFSDDGSGTIWRVSHP